MIEVSIKKSWYQRPALWIALAGLLVLAGMLSYGTYRVNKWQEARKERAERDRIARLAQAPQVAITLIEGWTNKEIFKYLADKGAGTEKEFEDGLVAAYKNQVFLQQHLGAKPNLEGFLFPDTYRVFEDASPENIVEKLLQTFETKFTEAAVGTRDIDTEKQRKFQIAGFENLIINGADKKVQGLTLQELVTLASIVEKESGMPGEPANSQRLQIERQTVAGIFYNRLAINMALESDATVNYITKSGRASATYKDLEIDSPYNTYKYPGLPPGAIGNPSYSSLYAVLHPIKTDYYYFLHKQPSGEVVYSKTFEEHLTNKQKYLRGSSDIPVGVRILSWQVTLQK